MNTESVKSFSLFKSVIQALNILMHNSSTTIFPERVSKSICKILCVAVLFLGSQPIFAQLDRPMAFDTYRVDDGLAGNYVQCMIQDFDGNMWIGTYDGLSRFDGYSFKNYRSNASDSTAILANYITSLAVDKKGNLWVLTPRGLNLYDAINDRFIRFPDLKLSYDLTKNFFDNPSFLKCLLAASDGTLYISAQNGLVRFNHETGESHYFLADSTKTGALKSGKITDLAESPDGKIFVATRHGGINVLDPATGIFTDLSDKFDLPSDIDIVNIRTICITKDNVLWVGTDDYATQLLYEDSKFTPDTLSMLLWNCDLKTGKVKDFRYFSKNADELIFKVTAIIEAKDGTIWMTRISGLNSGLSRYIPETGSFQKYGYDKNDPTSLAWDFTTTIAEDRQGDIWVGTSRGVSKSNAFKSQFKRFSIVPDDPYNLKNLFYVPAEIAPEQFFLFSDGGREHALWNKKDGTYKFISLFIRLDGLVFDSVYTKSIWFVGLSEELTQVNYKTYKTNSFKNPNAPPMWQINHILPISADVLLLSTSRGLWQYSISKNQFSQIQLQSKNEDSESQVIMKSLKSADGIYFVLTSPTSISGYSMMREEINLSKIDLKKKEILVEYNYQLSDGATNINSVAIFFKGSNGKLWMAGTNRMISFDPVSEQFKEYAGEPAYRGKQVTSAFEDGEGYIWFNSEDQISRLDSETGKIQSINKSDGLATFRINTMSSTLSRKGEVIFAGVGGLTYFDPRDFKTPTEHPNILISSFEAGNEKRNVRAIQESGDALELPFDESSIDIEFKSISFSNAEFTTYKYLLKGWQSEWQNASTRRFVQYTNLPPGDYTFKVMSTNSNGLESEHPAEIAFKILPPWWRTWWAYVVYILILLLILKAVEKTMRKRAAIREEEKNRQKELAQAKEIEKAYHNLEVAHSNLKSAQDQLVQQEKLASLGQLTAGIAHEMKNPLNFVNNFSELNIEMVDEAMEELAKLPKEHAEPIREILVDVKTNLKKILQHGTRADGIVTSMLQHSRGGTGQMEPTDLNTLLTEFVNLSFHGMQAGKNPIDVELNFDLDENIGQVNLVSEDFSRVLLNIANNAFDAMREKTNTDPDYKPVLSICSIRKNDKVEISIADNGPGIPEAIKDKILQPFFTTKKGTDGTGLGLSITHDIVKAHGGELKVDSKQGESLPADTQGTTFIIYLPMT